MEDEFNISLGHFRQQLLLDFKLFRQQLVHDFKDLRQSRQAPPKSTSPSTFSGLLQELESSHASFVAELREQVERLQAKIGDSGASCARVVDVDSFSLENFGELLAVPSAPSSPPQPSLHRPSLLASRSSLEMEYESLSSIKDAADVAVKVFIASAEGIRRFDSLFGETPYSPYCVCEIRGKPVSSFKTHGAKRGHSPIWNHEEILFKYSAGDTVSFTVFDRDLHGNVVLLGSADVLSEQFLPDGFNGKLVLERQDAIQRDDFMYCRSSMWPSTDRLSTKTQDAPILDIAIDVTSKGPATPVLPVCLKTADDYRFVSATSSKKRKLFDDAASALGAQGTSGLIADIAKKNYSLVSAIPPDAPVHLVWDILGILVLLIDLLWIPMQVFDPQVTTAVEAINWTILIYWTLDILVTLNTGYYSKHMNLVRRRVYIAKRYLRGWFIFDFTLVVVDWYTTVQKLSGSGSVGGTSAGAARAGRLARLTRIFRLLRLMRLAKLRRFLFILQSLVDSEWIAVLFTVGKNMAAILMLNHYIACGWFIVGKSYGTKGWVHLLGYSGVDYGTQYLACLVWSLTQFTPGSSPIKAMAPVEHIYVALVLSCSIIVSTCFVGNISVTMGTVWAANRYNSHQVFLLKKFLQQRRISRELATQVTRYIDCVVELRHKVVPIGRVEYLKLLSGPLSVELHTMIFQPYLVTHYFFSSYLIACRSAVRQLCSTAVETEGYAKNDSVFRRGQLAKKMYFVTRGALAYRFENIRNTKQTVKLDVNSSVSEHTLWIAWKHRGHLKGLSDCEVIYLLATKFWDITFKATSTAYMLAREEAFDFASKITTCESFGPSYVSDIPHEHMASLLSAYEVHQTAHINNDVSRAEHLETEILAFSDSESELSDDLSDITMTDGDSSGEKNRERISRASTCQVERISRASTCQMSSPKSPKEPPSNKSFRENKVARKSKSMKSNASSTKRAATTVIYENDSRKSSIGAI